MALNTSKCNHLTPLRFKGLSRSVFIARTYAERCLGYSNSVCPSVTHRYCVKTNEPSRMMPFSQLGSPLTLVFGDIRFISIFARDRP